MFKSEYFTVGEPLHIPIIKDISGNTSLHIALGMVSKKTQIWMCNQKQSDSVKGSKEFNSHVDSNSISSNFELASILFDSIKDYPLLHSSPYLLKAIIRAVEIDLSTIGDYLDARMFTFSNKQISST